MRLQQSGVDGKIRWRATVGLDIYMPLGRVEAEKFESSAATEVFHLINYLIATVVAGGRVAFTVLVCKTGSQAFAYCWTSIVLTSNKFNRMALTFLFLDK
jgi:hypothetical protein